MPLLSIGYHFVVKRSRVNFIKQIYKTTKHCTFQTKPVTDPATGFVVIY